MTDSEKLLKLAEWFDISDLRQKGHINDNEVQKSLREIAERIKHHPSEPAETGVAEEILMNCCIEAMPSRESEIREAFDKDRSYQEDDDLFFTKIIESFSKAMTTYAEKRCAEKEKELIGIGIDKDRSSNTIATAQGYIGYYNVHSGTEFKVELELLKLLVSYCNSRLFDGWNKQDEQVEQLQSELTEAKKEIDKISDSNSAAYAKIELLKTIGADSINQLNEANKRIESIDAHRSRLIESVKKWGGAWRKCRAELKEAKSEVRNELIRYTDQLKAYTHESHAILGHDERESSELVDIFLKTK